MTQNTISRRNAASILSTEKVTLDTPVQDVDHSLVKTTGIALPDAAGIENEGDTKSVKKAFNNERFMAEIVEIYLQPAGSENEHQFCEVTVNGDHICLPRNGAIVGVKRYHLAVIASAKAQRLVQTKVTAPDGSMGYQERAQLQPMYPFSVVNDPNPAGVTWLRQMMQRS